MLVYEQLTNIIEEMRVINKQGFVNDVGIESIQLLSRYVTLYMKEKSVFDDLVVSDKVNVIEWTVQLIYLSMYSLIKS